MAALDPIAGISLEHYADLAAKMKDCGGDQEVCVQIAATEGVDRATWEAAQTGWNQRMYDPATAGEVAMAFMPLYQAALQRAGMNTTCAFEDYVAMSALVSAPGWGLDRMYAHFRLTPMQWSQISVHWVGQLNADLSLASRFGFEKQRIMDSLAAGGHPPAPLKSAY
jgi:hypothetical protein